MTLAGSGDAVEGVVGIAAHPQTGVLYVIVDTNPNNTRIPIRTIQANAGWQASIQRPVS
jgi:hypothetical protein